MKSWKNSKVEEFNKNVTVHRIPTIKYQSDNENDDCFNDEKDTVPRAPPKPHSCTPVPARPKSSKSSTISVQRLDVGVYERLSKDASRRQEIQKRISLIKEKESNQNNYKHRLRRNNTQKTFNFNINSPKNCNEKFGMDNQKPPSQDLLNILMQRTRVVQGVQLSKKPSNRPDFSKDKQKSRQIGRRLSHDLQAWNAILSKQNLGLNRRPPIHLRVLSQYKN